MAKDYLGIPGIFLLYIYITIWYDFFLNIIIKFLYILATSVPSERIFSSAADVVKSDRACLAPETIRAIMCLKHWYFSDIID